MRLPWPVLLFALASLANFPAGCGVRGTARCREALKERRYDQAIATCEAAWKASRDPMAAAAATTAHLRKGHFAEVRALAEQLVGTAGESEALLNVGRVHLHDRRKQDARAAFEKAIALAQKNGDHKAATVAAHELYQLALAQARYADALAALAQTEQERQTAGLEELRAPVLTALFDVLYELGDIGAARGVVARAAPLVDAKDPDKLQYLRAKQALVHQADGSWALERQALEETLALNQRSATPRPSLTWSTLLNLAELAIERHDLGEAGKYLTLATNFHRENHKPGGTAELVLLHRQATYQRENGELGEARRLIRAAQALQPEDDVAWEIATDAGEIAEALGDAAGARRCYEDAIAIVDRIHDAMGTSELQLWSLAKKRRPFARLFALHVRRGETANALALWDRYQTRAATERLLATSNASGDSVAALSQSSRQRLEFLTQALGSYQASTRRAGHARSALGGLGSANRINGLFYFEGSDDVYLITVRGGAVAVRGLGRRPGDLAADVAAFIARPEDGALAGRLGAILLPAGSLPTDGGTIYISPAPGLAEVAFAALVVGGTYLVEHAPLAYIPNLAVFARPLRRPSGIVSDALILADPLGDLPEARAEAEDLSRRFGAPTFVGAEAKKHLLLAAGARPLIHLATHSGLGLGGPWIQFHDGRLHAPDILNISLAANIVVLPTCASAVGTGPGITPSLAASFLAAGAESVVGSLRSIEDHVSRDFMRAFYQAGGAADPARAVAEVQRRWARERPVQDWSSFVVFGRSAVTAPDRGRPIARRSPFAGSPLASSPFAGVPRP
jgi:tetratricopeptide (TPR) repeat protein